MPWSDVAKAEAGGIDQDPPAPPPIDASLATPAGQSRRERICAETGWTREQYNANRERFIALVEEFQKHYAHGRKNKIHYGNLRRSMDARRFFSTWEAYKGDEKDPKPKTRICYICYGDGIYKAIEKKYWDMLDTTKALPFLRHQTTLKQVFDDMNIVGGIEVWGYPGVKWSPPPAWE